MAHEYDVEMYGLWWISTHNPIERELHMIRKGGQWTKKDGGIAGNGNFFHYKQLQSLLWPEDDHHRWSDLMLKEILENTITAIQGPKDSGKTHVALAKYGLVDYFCFPFETLILISSTDVRGLELRVWGDLKSLFQRAKERHPSLAGNMIDSKHAITTQSLKEDQVRDMRKGIACFVTGSLVDTPTGKQPIESLKVGDEVLNATGIGTLSEVHHRIAPCLVRVHLNDGRTIDCTPEHPFFTRRGWVKAVDLRSYETVFSAHETVRLLWGSAWPRLSESQTLFGDVPRSAARTTVRLLQRSVSTVETKGFIPFSQREILQHGLRKPVGSGKWMQTGNGEREVFALRNGDGSGSSESSVLLCGMPAAGNDGSMWGMREAIYIAEACDDEASNEVLQSILQAEIRLPQGGIEQPESHDRGKAAVETLSGLHPSPSNLHTDDDQEKQSALVRNGLGLSRSSSGRGNRRWASPTTSETSERRQENKNPDGAWVDRVEVLNAGSDERFDVREGGYHVHNLEVEGHPSYSVNGVLVHNCIPCMSSGGSWLGLGKYVGIKQKRRRLLGDECQMMRPAFLEAVANMNSGDFKGVFVGNPLGEGDPLDKIAEPKDGWGAEGEFDKTTVWQNRFLNGHTVNLVGTDSPNFDFPQDQPVRYPYLIHADSINRVVEFYGKDSLQYYSQCLGVRRAGLNARRVITRQLCMKFGAMDPVYWKGTPLIKIFAIDAAYGNIGGDRCVGEEIHIGLDVNGKQMLFLAATILIPVSVKDPRLPEDQIAEFSKDYCEKNGIPAENVFYDATGRGSLGTSFARVWSPYVNPIEFGGAATERAVSADLYIFDEERKEQRLKRCDEHYSKFVTELWFTVRYTIESGQLRGMTEEILAEGCMREWKMVRGNKIEIETKADTKERMGRSPDIFDAVTIGCEGARRKGFVIARLANSITSKRDEKWKHDLRQRSRELRESYTLEVA